MSIPVDTDYRGVYQALIIDLNALKRGCRPTETLIGSFAPTKASVTTAEIVVKLLGETRGRHLDAKTAHAFKRKCVTAESKLVEQEVTLRIGGRALNQLRP